MWSHAHDTNIASDKGSFWRLSKRKRKILHSAQRPKCFKNCVTKKLELFQDIPNLVEAHLFDMLFSQKASMSTSTTTSRFKNVIPCSRHKYCFWQRIILKTFQKKKKDSSLCFWSCFVPFGHASPDIYCSKDKNFEFYNSFPTFWGQKMKFTIHLSLFTVTIHLLLFMTLFTSNFCLFKGGCPLYFKQVLVDFISGLLS